MSRLLRSAAPAVLLAALVLLPFHDKAFTTDDTFFLSGARHAASDPWHPSAFDIVWFDAPERVSPAAGPLMSWLLLPAVRAEREETAAHAMEFLFLALALWATAALGRRLGLSPATAAAAALLLAVTPTALAMAGTAMADVPAMALGVAGLERLLAWRQERRWHQGLLAAVWLGLAPLARLHAVLFLGVGLLFLLEDPLAPATWLRTRWSAALPLAGAVLLPAAVLAITWDHTPGAPGLTGTASRLSSLSNVGRNLGAYLTHWTLALPLSIPWLALRPRPVLRRWWLLAAGFALMLLLLPGSARPKALVALAAALSLAVLFDLFADAWQRRDGVGLALGAWLLLPLAPLPYPHLPAKYLLASAPAAALLLARLMAQASPRRALAVLGTTALAGVALGVAILRADAAFGDLGRRAAAALVAPQVQAGKRVWFVGHWGFQWYAERAGGRHLTLTPPWPELGDLLVMARNTDRGHELVTMLRQDFRLAYLLHVEESGPGGRLLANGAGFFSNGFGYLPWSWGSDVLDGFVLWRVDDRRAVPGAGLPR